MDVKDVVLGITVAIGFSAYLLASLARGRFVWAGSRLTPLVVAFVTWATITLVYSQYRWSTLSELGRLYAHVGIYWLVISTVREMSQVRRILGVAAAGAIPAIVYAFAQAMGRDPIRWNEGAARVFSTLGNPTYFAGYLVLLVPLLAAVAWPRAEEQPTQVANRSLVWASTSLFGMVALLLLFCLFLTVSLSPIIGLGLGAFLAVVVGLIRYGHSLSGRTVLAVIVVGALSAGLFAISYYRLPNSQKRRISTVLSFRDPYGEERRVIRDVGWEIYTKHPLTGTGYGTYRIVSLEPISARWYSELKKSTTRMLVPNYAHNEYIQVLAGTGIVGGVLFVLMLGTAYWVAFRVSLRHPEAAWSRMGAAALVGMTAFLFQNFFGVTFRTPGAVTFFWLALGFLAVADTGVSHREEPGQSASPQPLFRTKSFLPVPAPGLAVTFVVLAATNIMLGGLLVDLARAGVLAKRAEFSSKSGNFRQAVEYGKKAVSLSPYNTQAYYLTAYAAGALGDHEESLRLNQKALELLPGNGSVYYNLGVNYKELGDFDKAEECFERAIELVPTSPRHHAALAEILILTGRLDEALAQAKTAAELDPKSGEVFELLSRVEARRGRQNESLDYLLKAAQLAKDDLDLWQRCATIAFARKRWEDCRTCSAKWLKYDPYSVEAMKLLGVSYFNLGNFKAARSRLQKVLKSEPNDQAIRFLVARCHTELGAHSKARRELKEVIRIAPESYAAARARAMLKTLGN
ncbi:MAG: tetratricopeptide repeat protein [Armatimonadetes bacterium]|nr:tetratricopeptide repeat protein [Armatimonadota bacterium]